MLNAIPNVALTAQQLEQPQPPTQQTPPTIPPLPFTQTMQMTDASVPELFCQPVLGEHEDNNCPFYKGQRFDDDVAIINYVNEYAAPFKLDILLERSTKK